MGLPGAPAEAVLPIAGLHARPISGFTLLLGDVKHLRNSGWRGFSLLLGDEQGIPGARPVVHGIYSRGGKDGVRAWMDIDYSDEVGFTQGMRAGTLLSLREAGLDRPLFRILGEAIPPGGHLMVSYEGEHGVHRETWMGLSLGVPPAVTPIGCLLFHAGFRHVKDWYLAEGGQEGPRKLWGEKAPDAAWDRTYRQWTEGQIRAFLRRDVPTGAQPLAEAARARAEELLAAIRDAPP